MHTKRDNPWTIKRNWNIESKDQGTGKRNWNIEKKWKAKKINFILKKYSHEVSKKMWMLRTYNNRIYTQTLKTTSGNVAKIDQI